MTAQTSYSRGQVTWALWKAFTWNTSAASSEPSSIFRARIKRLLELDRKKKPSKKNGPHAFAKGRYPGTAGTNMAFREFDAYYLGLSLNMLDAGLKPADIMLLLRQKKHKFQSEYESMLKNPRAVFRRHEAKSTPGSLSDLEKGNQESDIRVFALYRKVELREVFPLLSTYSKKESVIVEPVFCRGFEELEKSLEDMGISFRHIHMFELAYLVWDVKESLAAAPEVRRGRP